jgi:hypothetical protein
MRDDYVCCLTENGLRVFKILKKIETWKDNYTIQYYDNLGKYIIKELKGTSFNSEKDAEEYALLHFCNNLEI